MLVHLSNTSPYVCDLSRGTIEEVNRMASVPTKKATAFLEEKESFPKVTRTPLKLLALEEIPMDTTATDINASLQPVWYTEQTIADEQSMQHEDTDSITHEQGKSSILLRSILPPIPSESSSFEEDEEQLPIQPSLMHKSSTFTIEPSINLESRLEELEKEHTANQPNPPSDDSFRALEQLLGLGSGTTVRDSPKTNHDTLSLTIVTPTDIINSTSTSLRMSIAPKKDTDSQPSSQEISAMPTIESINSINPPSFLMENTTIEDEPTLDHDEPTSPTLNHDQPTSTTLNHDEPTSPTLNHDEPTPTTLNHDEPTSPTLNHDEPAPTTLNHEKPNLITLNNDESTAITLNDDEPTSKTLNEDESSLTMNVEETTSFTMNQSEIISIPVSQEETTSLTINQEKLTDTSGNETSFSFELNDFSNESTRNDQPTRAPAASPVQMPNIRAPTCTDVAIRALLKSRRGGRVSQPVKADSPLARPNKARSSAPTARMLRSSCRRISTESSSQIPTADQMTANTTECFVNETMTDGKTEFIEMITVNEEDETEQEKSASLTLNLSSPQIVEQTEQDTNEQNITPPKPMIPMLSREYTFSTPKRRSSIRRRSMLNSTDRTPMQQNQQDAEQHGNNSMLNVLLTKPTEVQSNLRKSTRNSTSIASKSMLNVLLTQPTIETEPTIPTTPTRASKRKTIHSPAIASQTIQQVLPTESIEIQSNPPTPKRKATSIASKSLLGVLLTQQTTETQTEEILPIEQLESSPSTRSNSMLGILLSQPTENNTQPSSIEGSPSIASRSMLNVLLTNPTENVETPTIDETLPIQSSTPQNRRSQAQSTPRATINPLHSSTPSARRNKSLQIVSIGEEEQVSTIVPQQQEIDIVRFNQTNEAIQQAPTSIIRTIEMGVQTTPSIDILTRRRFQTLEQQTTPIVETNKTSESMIVQNEDKPITPMQTKVVINLQRRVCFQLTPTTDARLTEKEKLEDTLRGLKPDVVIPPAPIELETEEVKKPTKSKKKSAAHKKKATVQNDTPIATKRATRSTPVAKVAESVQRVSRKDAPAKSTVTSVKQTQSKEKSPVKRTQSKGKSPVSRTRSKENSPVKRTRSKEKAIEEKPPVPPTKRTQSKDKPMVVKSMKQEIPIKRSSRKRPFEEVKQTPVETTVKRVRNSKSVDLPSDVPKTQVKKEEKQPIAQFTERRTRNRSTNNQTKNSPVKTTTATARTNKRRLESVDKTENCKKKVEQERSLPIVELNNEERQKIENLTVAGLKSRLNRHNVNIPKTAKKADLIALLIQFETQAFQNAKLTKCISPVTTTTMTTRHRKK